MAEKCSRCKGSGKEGFDCERCHGTGREPVEYEEWPVTHQCPSGDWYAKQPWDQSPGGIPLASFPNLNRFAGFIYEYPDRGRMVSGNPIKVRSTKTGDYGPCRLADSEILRPIAVRMRKG